jgi:tRNA pseudouridine55 synthase
VDGVLLLDKPGGLSSNAALQVAKRLLSARKAGHTGTLDPMATGLLPLCFGEATKFAGTLLDADKTYEAVVKLGVTTATGDAEGDVISRTPPSTAELELARVMQGLLGTQQQLPPMFSALKHQGRPLYEYARAGQVVERAPRAIQVLELSWRRLAMDEVWLRTRVSKGTYVRALAEQIGAELGCGAHLSSLRRTGIGAMQVDQAIAPDGLERLGADARQAMLLPVDFLVRDLPALAVPEREASQLVHGQSVEAGPALSPGPVRLYDAVGRFLGVGEVAATGRVAPRRLLA